MNPREPSTFYLAGKEERRNRVGIRKSAIRHLRDGTRQYEEFLDGRKGLPWFDYLHEKASAAGAEPAKQPVPDVPCAPRPDEKSTPSSSPLQEE